MQETNDNPSFYVQYAYARINSLKKMALEKKIRLDKNNVKNININLSPPEVSIIKTLSLWPRIIETSVISKEPHRLVYYLIELAGKFHTYWSLGKSDKNYKILGEENLDLSQGRLLLLDMIQSVIKSGLELISVSVKDKM